MAEPLRAFVRSVLSDVHLKQVERDELYAALRDGKDSKLSEDEAIKRVDRSFSRVWVAIDPVKKVPLSSM